MHAKKIYYASEMAQLYNAKANEWLLMEIVERNELGRAEKLRLIKSAKDKDELYDYLMEDMEDWEWSNDFIFVYSDPDKHCEI